MSNNKIDMMSKASIFKELLSIDYRSLAAFRIMSSITLLYISFVYATNLNVFFTDEGLLSVQDLNKYFPNHRFSLLEFLNSPAMVWLLWSVLFVSAIFMLIGYWTRTATIICFVTYVSFVGRNPILNQGGDVLLPLLIFWAAFLPTGRVFSIDGALEKNRDLVSKPAEFSIATVGLLLQVLYVYVWGALLKTGVHWESNGTAVYVALHLDSFATVFAHIMREYHVAIFLLTYFVFYLELLAPLFLFFPDKKQRVRTISLSMLMLMHVGFRVFLNIGHFWLASLSSLMSYIPTVIWNAIAERYWSAQQREIKIYYDQDCGFCLKTCLLLREFFLPHNVDINPAQATPEIGEILMRENSWVVVEPNGNKLLHWDALIFVTKQSILMRPIWLLAYIIGKSGIGFKLYKVVGNSRGGLSSISSLMLPFNNGRRSNGLVVNTFLVSIIAVCLVWNYNQNLSKEDRFVELKPITPLLEKVGLTQRWSMFAPNPALSDGYPVISLKDSAGNEYFVNDGKLDSSIKHPESLEKHFENYRWRKYLNRISWYKDDMKIHMFGRFANFQCSELKQKQSIDLSNIKYLSIRWARNTSFKQKEDEYKVDMVGTWPCEINSSNKHLKTASK